MAETSWWRQRHLREGLQAVRRYGKQLDSFTITATPTYSHGTWTWLFCFLKGQIQQFKTYWPHYVLHHFGLKAREPVS